MKPDLTVITNVLLSDGIGRQGIGLIQTLYNDLSINTFKFEPSHFRGITDSKTLDILNKPFDKFGKVSFWTYILGLNENILQVHQKIDSDFKIAYSMFESDAIPKLWVQILNKYYDILIVPDKWLINVYKSSGVKIPIFVLPLGIMLPEKISPSIKNDIFTFGMTGGFWERKNHIKTMEAFHAVFKDNPKVKLKIHGRFGPFKNNVLDAYHKLGSPSNIEIISHVLETNDYNQLMESIDCYVFISKGEGFSITPREAIALSKPCILSKNTAHRTICESGFAIPIESNIKIPAFYEVFGKQIGSFFDCETSLVSKTMLEVYQNYDKYQNIVANGGKEWVTQYLWNELKSRYLTIIKPSKILLGDKNYIHSNYIETTSKPLFNKIKETFKI
jgi:glycosyltransferase involved in cell wall biosynthesis